MARSRDVSCCMSAAEVDTFFETTPKVFYSSFKWTIHNFSLAIKNPKTSSMKTALLSPAVKIRDYDPIDAVYLGINYFCDINNKPHGPFVSIQFFIEHKVGSSYCGGVAACTLSILDSNCSKFYSVSENSFCSSRFYKFISIEELQKQKDSILVNDTLTLLCEIKIMTDLTTELCRQKISNFEKSSHELSDDLEQLIDDKKFGDVTLTAGERKFHTYKGILAARSRVFAAMFEHKMKENAENNVDITDISGEILEELLRYIYTDKVRNLSTTAVELLDAAHKYELEGLRVMCEKTLYETLDIANAAELWIIADRYGAGQLKTHILRFIDSRKDDFVRTEGYKKLEQSHSNLIIEAFRTCL